MKKRRYTLIFACIISFVFIFHAQLNFNSGVHAETNEENNITLLQVQEQDEDLNAPVRPYKIWVTVDKFFSGIPPLTIFVQDYRSHNGLYKGTLSLKKGTYYKNLYRYHGYLYDQSSNYIPLVTNPIDILMTK